MSLVQNRFVITIICIIYLSKTVTMLSFIIIFSSNVAMSWSLIPIPFARYLGTSLQSGDPVKSILLGTLLSLPLLLQSISTVFGMENCLSVFGSFSWISKKKQMINYYCIPSHMLKCVRTIFGICFILHSPVPRLVLKC